VVILDMRPACSYTDFFVVCTGQNPRQAAAIYDEVYAEYSTLHDYFGRGANRVMRKLRAIQRKAAS